MKMKMKRSLLFILIIFNMLMVSSCYDYKESEELQLLFGLGIDSGKNNDEIIVTIQSAGFKNNDNQSDSASSKSSSDSNQFSSIYKASGRTMLDALSKLQEIMGKELFFGYIKVIVIGDEAAKNHMEEIMSFLYMSPRIRGSAYLLIAKEKASDTLGTVNLSDSDLSSKSLEHMVTRSVKSGVSLPLALSDYYNIILTEGWEPAILQICYKKNSDAEENADDSDELGIVSEQRGYHILRNMVVFNQDKKVGVLDEKETLCFALITNKAIKKSNCIVKQDTSQKNAENYFGFRILHNKSKIKTFINEDEILINVDISVQVSLEEYIKNEDLTNLDVIHGFEKTLSSEMKKTVQNTIRKVQKEYQSDIFGFGHKLFQQHTKEWNEKYKEQWNEIFPKVKTQVTVNAKMLNTGSKLEPLRNKEY